VANKHRHHPDTSEPLAEILSRGEKAMDWVGENAVPVLSAVALLLLLAAGYGFYDSSRESAESDAADALAEAREKYLVAMGASPGALEVPELANPAAGAAIRAESRERFREVADEHAGTAAAALARLEEGNLAADGGDDDTALEIWRAAVADRPADDPFAGSLQMRIAQTLEVGGDWAGAAAAFAAAGDTDAYPFRYWAMAEAARCFMKADQPTAAFDLYTRIQAEAPDLMLLEHLKSSLKELSTANRS
jgi:predicted negative regulator of RcsB-dependent stress response